MFVSVISEKTGVAREECRRSDAELLKLCKDAGRQAECLRCLRERVASGLHNDV